MKTQNPYQIKHEAHYQDIGVKRYYVWGGIYNEAIAFFDTKKEAQEFIRAEETGKELPIRNEKLLRYMKEKNIKNTTQTDYINYKFWAAKQNDQNYDDLTDEQHAVLISRILA